MQNLNESMGEFFNMAAAQQTNITSVFQANLDGNNNGIGPLLGASITNKKLFPKPVKGYIVGFSFTSRFDKFGNFALFAYYSELFSSFRLVFVDLDKDILVTNNSRPLTMIEATDIKGNLEIRDKLLMASWKNPPVAMKIS